ncbi:MAG: substrate-binding domain-containing protein, partial [Verrucomicrobiota bacterium]
MSRRIGLVFQTLVGVLLSACIVVMLMVSCNESRVDTVSISGSDMLRRIMSEWSGRYTSINPQVSWKANAEGAGPAIRDLIDGSVGIAFTTRRMKGRERDQFIAAHGIPPAEHLVGYHAIAIFVHPDNPVKAISMEELKAIWCEDGGIDNWSQLGGPDLPIMRA